jgi:hypothetical protein
VNDAGGVVNGKLDPGETADLILVLRNAGSGVGATTGRLESKSPYLQVLDGSGAFGAAGEGETTASSSDAFRVRALEDAPVEMPAYCDLVLSGSGYVDTITVPVVVGDSMNLPAGPDAYGYRIYDYTDSCYSRVPAYDWYELRGIGTLLTIGGDETRQLPLPDGFGTWRYYGTDYDTISICSNGWVAPGWTDRCDFVNVILPYGNSPSNIVAVQWDDLDPTAFGNIWYFHDSVHHRFIVEYDSVPYFGHLQDWEKVQVQVCDRTVATPTGDNSIVIQFKTANNYSQATVGLQNRDGSAGLTHTWSGWYPRVSAPLRAERALRFEPVELTGTAEPRPSFVRTPVCVLSVSPNPFRTAVCIRLSSAQAGASAAVFAADGRQVAELGQPGGSGTWSWNCRGRDGHRLTPGLYFVRVRTGSGEFTQKTVLSP